MPRWIFDLAWLSSQMGLIPRTVCECGVGPLDISIAPSFVGFCERFLLIEPIAEFADAVERTIGQRCVHRVAIGTKSGQSLFVLNGGSSYLAGTWSPTPVMAQTKIIPIVTFDTLDDGEIDVLNLDCEGQEWAVLRVMKSRPKLIVIEVWEGHPHTQEIFQWFSDNKYTKRFSTGPTSETFLYSL